MYEVGVIFIQGGGHFLWEGLKFLHRKNMKTPYWNRNNIDIVCISML